MRFIIYGSIHDRGTFVWKDIGSKTQCVVRVLGKVEYQISMRLTCRVPLCVVETVTVFGIYFTCQLQELVPVPDVLQEYQIFSI